MKDKYLALKEDKNIYTSDRARDMAIEILGYRPGEAHFKEENTGKDILTACKMIMGSYGIPKFYKNTTK